MTKPSRHELIKANAEYLPAYLNERARITPVISDLDPKLNIANIEELLEYYFLLTGKRIPKNESRRSQSGVEKADTGGISDTQGVPVGVIDFVELLPSRLRSLDPATTTVKNLYENGVQGSIDWQDTIKHRYQSGGPHRNQYVCTTRQQTVNTIENQVLIILLHEIVRIYERYSDQLKDDPSQGDWFSTWENGSDLREIIESQLNNVYLSNLEKGELRLDSRSLKSVKNSRTPLYRESATLLENLRRIQRNDLTAQEARKLLALGLLEPPREGPENREVTATLYELYWIFKILEAFDDPVFEPITGKGDQLIAEWSAGGSQYMLYHDWDGKVGGDTEYLDIGWGLDDLDDTPWSEYPDNFLHRRHHMLQYKQGITANVFGGSYGSGTPDIVLLKLNSDSDSIQLEGILVGEVKHTDDLGYVKEGLDQLLKYGTHARLGSEMDWHDNRSDEFIAGAPDFLSSDNVEMCYFIGDSSQIRGDPPSGINIYGFDDELDASFKP